MLNKKTVIRMECVVRCHYRIEYMYAVCDIRINLRVYFYTGLS